MNDLTPTPRSLSHVTDWVFDLDNTLYPRECNLFAQIDMLISHYMVGVTQLPFDEARALQKAYYRDYGTTLNGLMQLHEVDPDHFLNTVHAIDYSPVEAHPDLVDAIRALPGRKFILTNGDVGHARSVLNRLGNADELFEDIFDIRAMSYKPKPLPEAYEAFFSRHGIDARRAAMFDDLEKNLVVPHDTGMTTVQVIAGEAFAHEQVEAWELERTGGAHVHHMTADLAGFLRKLP
ncbi:MAG TPA: pyrimidine 5'-nucleotidase [Devosia sp.]|jgi:putative hydrolase of the HAD superfamily|uniref:pyrimidine 5'-nucleotidase n=1 Tax=Devosia sp. TaxID=1871048 RepID=UPI002DDDB2E2|nr:pyrimidine 5'-nucleotidase [Devosia sp.]HEV2516072.1 pyrimidine 5'-nucleotidase [Devosia sp.]